MTTVRLDTIKLNLMLAEAEKVYGEKTWQFRRIEKLMAACELAAIAGESVIDLSVEDAQILVKGVDTSE